MPAGAPSVSRTHIHGARAFVGAGDVGRGRAFMPQMFFWMCSGMSATSSDRHPRCRISNCSRAASSAVPTALSISASTAGLE